MHEPYTCERLNQVRGGFAQLSEAVAGLEFDFTNPEVDAASCNETGHF